jgi:hypothetical protein
MAKGYRATRETTHHPTSPPFLLFMSV